MAAVPPARPFKIYINMNTLLLVIFKLCKNFLMIAYQMYVIFIMLFALCLSYFTWSIRLRLIKLVTLAKGKPCLDNLSIDCKIVEAGTSAFLLCKPYLRLTSISLQCYWKHDWYSSDLQQLLIFIQY